MTLQNPIQDDRLLLLQAGMAKIRAKFMEELPPRAAGLEELLAGLRTQPGQRDDLLARINHQAHRLHGQCGSFGLHEIGVAAARLERRIMDFNDVPQPAALTGVATDLRALIDQIHQSVAEG